MQIVIMRHGQTTANERHVYAGKTDVALTAEGERQARAAGVVSGVDRVYVSRLARARKTAEICFPGAELVEVDGLEEFDFGAFEQRGAAEMDDDAAYREWVEGRCVGPCPGGECRADFVRRTAAAIERIVREGAGRGEGRVVVVGHGGTVMAAMTEFADTSADYFSWQVGNCEGYRAQVEFGCGAIRFARWEKFKDLSFMAEPGALPKRAFLPAHSFISNTACEYFPCHEGVDPGEFNCLFCYCPLYALGPACGGDFTYTERGRKNCSACAIPHIRDDGARLVAEHYEQLAAISAQTTKPAHNTLKPSAETTRASM